MQAIGINVGSLIAQVIGFGIVVVLIVVLWLAFRALLKTTKERKS